MLRPQRGLDVWVSASLEEAKKSEDLSCDEVLLVFDNLSKVVIATHEQILKGQLTEYHIAQFFKSHSSFLDCKYRIGAHIVGPAHSKSRSMGDNYIFVSVVSKEFTGKSARRKYYYGLSVIGMLLGLISNLHFSLCEYAPRPTQEELGISNFQPCVELSSESKLIDFLDKFPEGKYVPISSKEALYSNIRLPDDTIALLESYSKLQGNPREAFCESLHCYQMSLDLQESSPTMSMVSLLSAMERMAGQEGIATKQQAACPHCQYCA